MPDSTDGQLESFESQKQTIEIETAQAGLQKLKLEIADLERKRGWGERIARYIPIITAFISIAGFLWGVYLFRDQQERDRITRQQDQISRDLNLYRTGSEQLLLFSSNQSMTVARVLSLREDLDSLIDSLYPPDEKHQTSPENQKQKDKLREGIYALISRDFDFTQTRQIQFDIAALQKWVDYQKGLAGGLNAAITEKYLQALVELHRKNPGAFEQIYVGQGGEDPDPDTLLDDPYRSLIQGFVCHLNLLSAEEKNRQKTKFGTYTGSSSLAAQLDFIKCPEIPQPPKPPSN